MNTELNKFTNPNKSQNKVQLSAYTIADNCTDITDLQDGINEIYEAIQDFNRKEKKAPSYFYHRLLKLENKLKKKQSANLITVITLSVTIRFKVNLVILKMAIIHCLNNHIHPTKKNVISIIKDLVNSRGRSILVTAEEECDINSTGISRTDFLKTLDFLRQAFNL